MNSNKPVVVITVGDPAGIGPEITARALKNKSLRRIANFQIINEKTGDIKIGVPSQKAGIIAVRNIKKAVRILHSIRGRKALVTGPINKYSLKHAGFNFAGHTELLADITKSKDVAMMFTAAHFRLTLVTRHIPLADVPKELSVEKIVRTTNLFHKALKNFFKIRAPRIGVAGLNPHAGEAGVIGNEEEQIIAPAVNKLARWMNKLVGPCPSDTLFRDLYRKKLDGVICMYHDQGLGPFKMLYFDKGVNVTLGLPFVRTSPDHGTAFDIAGKGIADPRSMIEAIKLAVRLA